MTNECTEMHDKRPDPKDIEMTNIEEYANAVWFRKKEKHDKRTETHPCDCDRKETHGDVPDINDGDIISRTAAIDAQERIMSDHPLDGYEDERLLINALKDLPSVQPEIIRCKDCEWWGYDDETGDVRVCHAAKHCYISSHWKISVRRTYRGDFYCADAERRTDE